MSDAGWDWIADLYARPGVKDACLRLQDDHGVPVTLLLWGLWRASRGRFLDPPTAATLALSVEAEVTAPLRAVRRALSGAEDAAPARAAILSAELAGERLMLDRLEALPEPEAPARGDVLALLCAATGAHGEAVAADLAILREAACLSP